MTIPFLNCTPAVKWEFYAKMYKTTSEIYFYSFRPLSVFHYTAQKMFIQQYLINKHEKSGKPKDSLQKHFAKEAFLLKLRASEQLKRFSENFFDIGSGNIKDISGGGQRSRRADSSRKTQIDAGTSVICFAYLKNVLL